MTLVTISQNLAKVTVVSPCQRVKEWNAGRSFSKIRKCMENKYIKACMHGFTSGIRATQAQYATRACGFVTRTKPLELLLVPACRIQYHGYQIAVSR